MDLLQISIRNLCNGRTVLWSITTWLEKVNFKELKGIQPELRQKEIYFTGVKIVEFVANERDSERITPTIFKSCQECPYI
jgi:hypothetical protein